MTMIITSRTIDKTSFGLVQTFWNGMLCKAWGVKVLVQNPNIYPDYWAKDIVGEIITAIKIKTFGDEFLISNRPEDGYDGYLKITEGKGMMNYSHRSLYGRIVENIDEYEYKWDFPDLKDGDFSKILDIVGSNDENISFRNKRRLIERKFKLTKLQAEIFIPKSFII